MSEEIDERKRKILLTVVKNFVLTGKPVGSKKVARVSGLGVSAATVRNEMTVLEKLGLLEQPHTSAGRVPTDKAYRYFVDMLMEHPKPSGSDTEAVEKLFRERTREMEGLFRDASILLSELTNATAMVFAPFSTKDSLRQVDMVMLSENRVILIIITSKGQVGRQLIELDLPINRDAVEKVKDYLNQTLSDLDLGEIHDDQCLKGARFGKAATALLNVSLEAVRGYMGSVEEKVFIGGTANIVRGMDYAGREWIQLLLAAMEKQYFILGLLKELIEERRLTVRIGEENRLQELQKCSFIGTSYPMAPGLFGSLGLVGPTSMDYAHNIGMVEFMADKLGHRFLRPSD